jgi:triacylglycerol lipase
MNPLLANQYDPANARDLALCSRLAYDDLSAVEVRDASTDTRVIILENETDVIVAFRGTQDLRNWLTDLDCRRLAWNGFKIHDGFEIALNSVFKQIKGKLAGCEQRIWLTGHSLGGALAMLCAYRLRHECSIAGVYTFGQPRVGNAGFRDSYNLFLRAKTFRVIHSEDLIPRIPWLLGAYRHAGHEVFYPGRGIALRCPGRRSAASLPQMDPPWFAHLPSDLRELGCGRVSLLSDHHVNTYVDLFA